HPRMFEGQTLNAAREDFRRARQQAALQDLLARFTGKSIDLLSYEDVRRRLRATGSADRGLQDIPVDAIVGTAGRYSDFTRDFLPRDAVDELRWARVMAATDNPAAAALPPIEVYQLGEAYFVRDGHHRVSVARQRGLPTIPAYVTEVRTKVPLTADAQPDELIRMAEYADFLDATRLDVLRPGLELQVSEPGQYERLLDHIEVHRFFVEMEREAAIDDAEAAVSWYDHAYLPVAQTIRERGMLRDFPGRTETDLYLWVTEHAAELREALGWSVKPEAAAEDLAARFSPAAGRRRMFELVLPAPLADGPTPGTWRRQKLEARYLERLFTDLLVPLSGEPASWAALDQALAIAAHDGSRLLGLHVVASEAARHGAAAQAVRADFLARCEAAGVAGALAIEAGDVAGRICERAALADLVVVHLAHPPSAQPLERLSSGFRALVRRCPRPLLAVPGPAAAIQRPLLAFDGSPKSKEALFVAAYLAGEWRTPLTVVTVKENGSTDDALRFARQYLEFHEVPADFREAAGPVPAAILRTAAESANDLILMGGYGARPVVEVILGSSVDAVLRATDRPLLLCR
ncbi:MAG: universal stress protein, partial [Anaerolineales bacterium]|nr:universal stress protein [Anaerolineales bacterium]